MPITATKRLAFLAGAVTLLHSGAALADTSPYYVGLSQSLGHESNLYRLDSGKPLPNGAASKSDTIYTTSIVAGVDQMWGRQRLNGSGSLRANRYAQNDQFNNNGYNLSLGLDWATVGRFSGRLGLSADRSLRRFDPAYQTALAPTRNIEDSNQISAIIRVGVVTRLTAEASASRNQVRYSASGSETAEYDQASGSLGVRYRLGGATSTGIALRESRVKFRSGDDKYKRRDIDMTGTWDPSGLTSVYARVSHTNTDHDLQPLRDFSGITAELRASTQLTGKIKLNGRLSRELGQGTSTFDLQSLTSSAEFNRTRHGLRISADYGLSAKITMSASLDHAIRNFEGTRFDLSGRDRTTTLNIGATWMPVRSTKLACNISNERRGVDQFGAAQVGNGYTNTGMNCYGQFILQ